MAGIMKLDGAKNMSGFCFLMSKYVLRCQRSPFPFMILTSAFLNSSKPAIPPFAYRVYLLCLSIFNNSRTMLKVYQPLPAFIPPAVLISIAILMRVQ